MSRNNCRKEWELNLYWAATSPSSESFPIVVTSIKQPTNAWQTKFGFILLKHISKNNLYLELFLVFFIYAKVCKVYYICLIWLTDFENRRVVKAVLIIVLVTVFHAILTSRQTCEKLPCLYENLMSNNFRKRRWEMYCRQITEPSKSLSEQKHPRGRRVGLKSFNREKAWDRNFPA